MLFKELCGPIKLKTNIYCSLIYTVELDMLLQICVLQYLHSVYLQELEDFETVSDFEVLMKSSHSHNGPNGPDRDEFKNHKDYNQEKPSKLKQR